MSEIPEDLQRLVGDLLGPPDERMSRQGYNALSLRIARAILAERERCAKVRPRVFILLLAAALFGGVALWTIWLAVVVVPQWSMMSVVALGMAAVFFSLAAFEST